MFLGVDIGNSHTVAGVFDKDGRIVKSLRIRTIKEATTDEIAVFLSQFLAISGLNMDSIEDMVISCVVPPLLSTWEGLCPSYLKGEVIIISSGVSMGMPILYKRPFEVGADRLVNSIAAFERFETSLIVIDYGTATTFDCVSEKGEYLGGCIAPGPVLAAESLFKGTSMLPRVDLFKGPEKAICQDTVSAMQAGIIYGFSGLTEGLIRQLSSEFPKKPKVVATGGLASVIAGHCPSIEETIPDLTLEGLSIIYRRIKGL